ncbi:MAG TPA: NYN domain-containing protein [Bacteroidetes bacterium]|nr:NYN domain-containing protein [Bacteroidota bacterium]
MNRLAILIDGNNFYKGCQLNFNRTDVDFRKLGLKLAKTIGGELLRIYYYNAHVSQKIDPLGYQRQQKFFDNLRATPFITLKLGHLVYHRIRNEHAISSQYFPTEKGIDVQIAVDMIRLGLLKSCEGSILVSGDSDYIYAVRFAKDLGSNMYIASFPQGGSTELRNEGDGFIQMDYDFIHDCFIRPTPMARREPYISAVSRRPVSYVHRQSPPIERFDPDEGFEAQDFGIVPSEPRSDLKDLEESGDTGASNEKEPGETTDKD